MFGEQVIVAEKAGADRIHIDVMDGHFVPDISMGAGIVQSLRRVTRLPLETHRMISDPDNFLEEFCDAGANVLVVASAIFGGCKGVTVAMDRLRASVDHEIYSQRD